MDFYSNIKKGAIICFLFLVSCFLFLIWQGIYSPRDLNLVEEKLFSIESGESLFQVAKNLEKEGLIKNRFFFNFYVILKGSQRELQAGEYSFSPSMAIVEIAEKIISGDVIKKEITIIEGWTVRDIEEYLQLGEIDSKLEGYLFPDTYEISPKDGLKKIVEKMLTNFERKLTPELREEITSQGKSIFEIIIMASLLEKEVKTLEEKELVSGILWKRLENNLPLQVDATISYITGKKTIKISRGELQIDSPYNTYKYTGLPSGPICNPGLESIKATIYPKESDFWYYLSAPDGTTIFSKTLKDHNIAKAKYLK